MNTTFHSSSTELDHQMSIMWDMMAQVLAKWLIIDDVWHGDWLIVGLQVRQSFEVHMGSHPLFFFLIIICAWYISSVRISPHSLGDPNTRTYSMLISGQHSSFIFFLFFPFLFLFFFICLFLLFNSVYFSFFNHSHEATKVPSKKGLVK